MSIARVLELSLGWGERPPAPGAAFLGLHRGGPATLLRWLEQQLGLAPTARSFLERVATLRAALASSPDAGWARSCAADPWSTAAELLDRADELRLAGWSGARHAQAPSLVNDLAALPTAVLAGSEAERLDAVLAAFAAGQRLPPHRCVLYESAEQWPWRWRQVLARLSAEPAPPLAAAAPAGTALRRVQDGELAGSHALDRSLAWATASGATVACEMVAAALASAPEALAATVVCAADQRLFARLDQALRRRGLPGGGSAPSASAHPVLEVLPLVLRLSWRPADPALAMALLTLDGGPVPQPAAGRLAAALVKQPGVGSQAWDLALAKLSDEGGRDRTRDRVLEIFHGQAIARGDRAPAELLARRCRLVAEWARGKANTTSDDDLARCLRAAATQASVVAGVVETSGSELSHAQLGRLLELAAELGRQERSEPARQGGPVYLSRLAEVDAGCRRLVWLGLRPRPVLRRRWSYDELGALERAGVDLDDGGRLLRAGLEADRRGLGQVAETVLALEIGGSEEPSFHPLWIAAQCGLDRQCHRLSVDRMLESDAFPSVGAWTLPTVEVEIAAPQVPATEWELAPGVLRERSTVSQSEIVTRIGCPLAWVLNYGARLSRASGRALPSELLVKGSFLHQVMAEVFANRPLPSPAEAEAAAASCFDQRIERDAVPLALPARAPERAELRRQVQRAAGLLAAVLGRGGYQVVGMERAPDPETRLLSRSPTGALDCLARREADGAEAVVDFKYGSRDKYPKLLGDGRAVQLAAYAAMRQVVTGAWPAVAYLLLNHGVVTTPTGGGLAGAGEHERVEGRGPEATWQAVVSAHRAGGHWLDGAEPVPVRPLQPPEQRSLGSELVIDEPGRDQDRASAAPCTYCDYQLLCGVRRPS